jgi:hypothetical protein
MQTPEHVGELSVTAQAALQEYENFKVAEAEAHRAKDAWHRLVNQLKAADHEAYQAAKAEVDRDLRNRRR